MRRARVATPLVAAVAITFGLAGVAAGGNGHGHGPAKDHKAPGAPVADPGGVIDLPPGYSYDVLARDCVDQVTSTESSSSSSGRLPALRTLSARRVPEFSWIARTVSRAILS